MKAYTFTKLGIVPGIELAKTREIILGQRAPECWEQRITLVTGPSQPCISEGRVRSLHVHKKPKKPNQRKEKITASKPRGHTSDIVLRIDTRGVGTGGKNGFVETTAGHAEKITGGIFLNGDNNLAEDGVYKVKAGSILKVTLAGSGDQMVILAHSHVEPECISYARYQQNVRDMCEEEETPPVSEQSQTGSLLALCT